MSNQPFTVTCFDDLIESIGDMTFQIFMEANFTLVTAQKLLKELAPHSSEGQNLLHQFRNNNLKWSSESDCQRFLQVFENEGNITMGQFVDYAFQNPKAKRTQALALLNAPSAQKAPAAQPKPPGLVDRRTSSVPPHDSLQLAANHFQVPILEVELKLNNPILVDWFNGLELGLLEPNEQLKGLFQRVSPELARFLLAVIAWVDRPLTSSQLDQNKALADAADWLLSNCDPLELFLWRVRGDRMAHFIQNIRQFIEPQHFFSTIEKDDQSALWSGLGYDLKSAMVSDFFNRIQRSKQLAAMLAYKPLLAFPVLTIMKQLIESNSPASIGWSQPPELPPNPWQDVFQEIGIALPPELLAAFTEQQFSPSDVEGLTFEQALASLASFEMVFGTRNKIARKLCKPQ